MWGRRRQCDKGQCCWHVLCRPLSGREVIPTGTEGRKAHYRRLLPRGTARWDFLSTCQPSCPNFIICTCDLEVTRLYCQHWLSVTLPENGVVVIAPHQTWNDDPSEIYWWNCWWMCCLLVWQQACVSFETSVRDLCSTMHSLSFITALFTRPSQSLPLKVDQHSHTHRRKPNQVVGTSSLW